MPSVPPTGDIGAEGGLLSFHKVHVAGSPQCRRSGLVRKRSKPVKVSTQPNGLADSVPTGQRDLPRPEA